MADPLDQEVGKVTLRDSSKNDELRKRSGTVRIHCKLTSFLYELMRDHLPPGKVEEIVRASEDQPDVTYTNGWLATYADDLAKRLHDG